MKDERQFAIFDHLAVGVLVFDASGGLQWMNTAARSLLDGPDALERLAHLDGSPLDETAAPWRVTLQQGLAVRDVVVRVRAPRPPDRFLRLSSLPLAGPNGTTRGAVVTVERYDEQRQMQEQMRAVTERARLLASLTRAFSETGSRFPAILQTIAQAVAETIGTACLVFLSGGEGAPLRLAGWHHTHRPTAEALAPLLEDTAAGSESLEAQVQASRSARLVDLGDERDLALASPPLRLLAGRSPDHVNLLPDATLPDATSPNATLPSAPLPSAPLLSATLPSAMASPLISSGHALGVLCVLRRSGQPPFNPDDLEFFQELAGRAAMAIENARLYAEEVQRNRELNALRDATVALMSTLDLELLLGRILDAAQHAVPAAERGLLFLAAPRTGRLELRAVLGFNDPRIRRAQFLKNDSIQRAIKERRPFLVDDAFEAMNPRLSSDPSREPVEGRRAGDDIEEAFFRSAIFAPLLMGRDVLGVLTLSSARPYAFSAADLRLLVSFAATTTAAIQNAMLHAEVQKIAITDPLTGLYNRRGLEELGQHEVERFQRFGHPLSLAMFDIDFFKRVNDTYGHGIGDQVLEGLAERCRVMVRQGDIFARYGGEEFVILLPETDLFQAVNIAERLRRATAETPFITDQGAISITISLGVTRASKTLAILAPLLEQADMALYDAKMKGRNRVEIG